MRHPLTPARRLRTAGAPATALAIGLLAGVPAPAQDIDVCGCEDMPSFGDFNNCASSSTWPPGSYVSGATVVVPLPADGVVVFDSVRLQNCRGGRDDLAFARNAANTPVKLLVKRWVYVDGSGGIRVSGGNGSSGTAARNGLGGGPGPGGARGGDGGHQDSVQTGQGGAGLGAGGGAPGGTDPLTPGADGQFFGADSALPLTGGSGGGGGSATSDGGGCSAGGGGGGGGALLIAANEYIRIDGVVEANGGTGGGNGDGGCARNGGRGSGGTIRLMSPRTYGSGSLLARGGRSASASNDGLIRIESFNDSISPTHVDPPAIRTRLISPLVNPVASTVRITEIDGEPVPEPPRGNVGLIDLQVPAPGLITMRVDTQGVPGGTTVEVAVKPEVGGDAARSEVVLDPGDCDAAGACFTFATFNLLEGAYYVEALATYRTAP